MMPHVSWHTHSSWKLRLILDFNKSQVLKTMCVGRLRGAEGRGGEEQEKAFSGVLEGPKLPQGKTRAWRVALITKVTHPSKTVPVLCPSEEPTLGPAFSLPSLDLRFQPMDLELS